MNSSKPGLGTVAAGVLAWWGVLVGGPAVVSAQNTAPGAASSAALDPGTPLPWHPDVVRGTLPCGLNYLVMKHQSPPAWATMWMHVHAGSLHETDAQRGLAHFLEHMAFNGSANFKPGTVTPFFQSFGMTFGRDQNAFTNYDQTTYQLSMPHATPANLAKGLVFLSDIAGRLTLSDEEIENERKIILEEKRRGAGGERRIADAVLERLAPESLIGRRAPIGTEESILGFKRDDFLAFYARCYTPSNITLVVLADAEPAEVVGVITSTFADLKPAPAPTRQDVGVVPTRGVRGIVAQDREVTTATVTLARVEPAPPPATTVGAWRTQLVERLAVQAFSLRVQAKMKLGELPFTGVQGRIGVVGRAMKRVEAGATGEPGKWKDILASLTSEVQRARLHGLQAREVDDVKTQALSAAERSAATEDNRPGPIAISGVNDSLSAGEPYMSAKQELVLGRALLPTITTEEVSKALVSLFDFSNVVFVLTGPKNIGEVDEGEFVRLAAAGMGVTPTEEPLRDRPKSLLSTLPKPGEFTELTQHVESAVWSGWLSNGIRVHHRFMDFRHNTATVTITLAGGELMETGETRGLARAGAVAWGSPATSALDSTQIRDMMNTRNLSFVGLAGGDAMTLRISGMPNQIEAGLQLAYLMLTDPKIEGPSFEQWRSRQLQLVERRGKDAAGVFSTLLPETVYPPGESRARPLTAEQISRLTPEAGEAFLKSLIASSPIEVSVVGDLEKDVAVELIAQYLGSLPARERISPTTLAARRAIAPPGGAKIASQEVETGTAKAQVMAGFFGPDASNHRDCQAMEMASRVLATRMTAEIREKKQLVYSIRPRSVPGDVYPGYGMFSAAAPTDPAKADDLADALDAMYREFAARGPTEDELTVARKQVRTDVEREQLEPAYWSRWLADLTYRGTTLDEIMAWPTTLQEFSGEQIRAAFGKYYSDRTRVRVIVKPRASEPTTTPAPGTGG